MSGRRLVVGAHLVVAFSLLATGCSDDGGAPTVTDGADATAVPETTSDDTAPNPTTTDPATTSTTVAPTTIPPASTAPPTTAPATTAPATTAPAATTAPSPSTSTPCTFDGTTGEVMQDFPSGLSAEIGADIRTGGQACFERLVIELGPDTTGGGDGFEPTAPGYWVRYADGPVPLGQTSDQFADIDGDAVLLITVAAWMTTILGDGELGGYTGPTDIRPTNVGVIRHLLLIDNFEGYHTWAVGLDRERPFRVDVLADPTRIVVDIDTASR